MSQPLQAFIHGIGLIAPGLPDWPTARAVLRGEQVLQAAASVLPSPAILPPAERRRASRVVKLSLALGLEAAAHAQADPATLATVFTASGADGHNCHALCEQLATDDRQISPTRFHNSVHNAAAGYWGIATQSQQPSQTLCAFDASFGAGLLDALAQVAVDQVPVLLIAYDSEYPEPLHAVRNPPDCAGLALLLAPAAGPQAIAYIGVSTVTDAPEHLGNPALETLRASIPALRSLPLLQKLALGSAGAVCLEYLAPLHLKIDVQPC